MVVIADDIGIFLCTVAAAVLVQYTIESSVLCKLTLRTAEILDCAKFARLLLVGKAVGTAENAVVNIALIINCGELQRCCSCHIARYFECFRFLVEIASVNGNYDVLCCLPLCVNIAILA